MEINMRKKRDNDTKKNPFISIWNNLYTVNTIGNKNYSTREVRTIMLVKYEYKNDYHER